MEAPQKTLALIKPDAVKAGNAEAICQLIELNGFTILEKKLLQLTKERAGEFYAEHLGKPFYENLVSFMSSGPIYALALSKVKAIEEWRQLMGPTNTNIAKEQSPQSIRALFGTDGTMNASHGSDSLASAARELKFFFSKMTLDPLPNADAARSYIAEKLQPTLVKGLTALCKEKPSAGKMEAVTWLANWLLENNPNKPSEFTATEMPLSAADEDDGTFATMEGGLLSEEAQIAAMEEEAAATRLQSHYRGFKARQTLKAQTGAGANTVVIESHTAAADEEAAAVKMQAHFKGHMARKSTKKMKAEEDAAATKVQASFRGKQARDKVKGMKES